MGWNTLANRDHRAPLGKACAEFAVFDEPFAQAIQTLGDRFAGKAGQGDGSFVHLDAGNDALIGENRRQGGGILRPLPNRLIKQDHAVDEVAQRWGREQHFPLITAMALSRGDVDRLESPFDGRKAFVRCEYAFAGSEQRGNG